MGSCPSLGQECGSPNGFSISLLLRLVAPPVEFIQSEPLSLCLCRVRVPLGQGRDTSPFRGLTGHFAGVRQTREGSYFDGLSEWPVAFVPKFKTSPTAKT